KRKPAFDPAAVSSWHVLPDVGDALADYIPLRYDLHRAVRDDPRPDRLIELDANARWVGARRQDQIVFQVVAIAVESDVYTGPGIVANHAVEHWSHLDPLRRIIAHVVGDRIGGRAGRQPAALTRAREPHCDAASARRGEDGAGIGEENLLAASTGQKAHSRIRLAAILFKADRSERERLLRSNGRQHG